MKSSDFKKKYEHLTKTNRGFSGLGEVIDTKGSKVYVQQSSSAEVDAVWIFTSSPDPAYTNPAPHLDKEGLDQLIAILQTAREFLEDYENIDYSE